MSSRAHLSDSAASDRLVSKLLKDLVKRLLEDPLNHPLGVLERVRLPVRVQLAEGFAQPGGEQV